MPDSSRAGAAPDAREGTRLGRFHVLERLGSGGMGVVYRALDGDQPVALKLIAPDLAERSDIHARFQREARVASDLRHPHIGEVRALEHIGGQWVLVMALYEGETLRARLARGPLAVGDALALALPLASALAAAHDHGVIHRDVKPANVFLTSDGDVKLLDFGLAKEIVPEVAQTLTREGALLGTLAYMAPEQLAGGVIDLRADLWALGVLLYEMIAGFPPFGVRAGRALGDEPNALSKLAAGVPPFLDSLVTRLLRRDPAQRPKDMHAVLAVLRERRSPARPHPLAWVAALVALALVGGGGALAARSRSRRAQAHDYEEGVRRLRQGDSDSAIAHLERATAHDPSFAPAWVALARAELMEPDLPKAFAAATQAAAHVSPGDRARLLEVEALQAQTARKWSLAVDRYQAFFRFFPSDVDVGLALSEVQMRGGQPQESLKTLQALRSVSDDPRIALGEAKAANNLSDWPRVKAATEEAIRAGEARGAVGVVARALLHRALARAMLGDAAGGLADLERARERGEKLGNLGLQALHYTMKTRVLRVNGDVAGAADAAEQAVALDRGIAEPSWLANDLTNAATARSEQGRLDRAKVLYRESLGVMRKLDEPYLLASALAAFGAALIDMGERTEADQALRESFALARKAGLEDMTTIALNILAWNDFGRGELKEAEAEAREVITIAKRMGESAHLRTGYENLSSVQFSAGDRPGARRSQEEALRLASEARDPTAIATERGWLAQYLDADGEYARAAELASQAAEHLHAQGMEGHELFARAVCAHALAALGLRAEAQKQIHLASPLLSHRLPVDYVALALISLAGAHLELGHPDEARQLLGRPLPSGVAVAYQHELRLMRAQLDTAHRPDAEKQLLALAGEARNLGFLDLARRADAAGRKR